MSNDIEKNNFSRWQLAAILDLKVKNRSNHQNNIKLEFLDPKMVENDILCKSVGQTIQKIIFKMADYGHFEFAALTDLARTFERGMGAKFCIYTLKKTNPLRNDPPLSTVTDLMSMTQLIYK